MRNAQEQVDQDTERMRQGQAAKANEKNPIKNQDTDKGQGKSAPKKFARGEKGFPDRKWRETIVM